ncbi:AbrB/MazE/SpoVT family DNA-binding domain-containing protein [Alkalimarinus coralli]|uniref:AbrB/MazE/SpoVT family DNA-binding domain-containing protein n=1 Tax=Alkalimarinus coralli TaxID=2935863 RepID=UPI00202ADD5D|nr:AbrB/MazE/SpoVT family DNA-binding domain-containing protein [Alkalimarinus coralli]
MRTTIRKIGNSAGAILPATVLKKLNLSEGDVIEVSEDGKRIVIEPRNEKPKYSLTELMAQCDEKAPLPKELEEWNDMQPTGKEVW